MPEPLAGVKVVVHASSNILTPLQLMVQQPILLTSSFHEALRMSRIPLSIPPSRKFVHPSRRASHVGVAYANNIVN